MGFRSLIIATIILFGHVGVADAQSNITTAPEEISPVGTVDILVEADTYTPTFYRGRAEPVSGQPIKLIAIPSTNIRSEGLVYTWKVGSRTLPETGPTVKVAGPVGSSLIVQLTVSEQGRVVAQKSESVVMSEPELLVYEMNALRGRSATAIGNEYNLIGSETEFVAVPYFTPLNIGPLRGAWHIDGQHINLGNDWQHLVLEIPENPKPRYEVKLDVTSQSGFMKGISKLFYVNMGL